MSKDAVTVSGTKVYVREGEPIERALRKFKKKVAELGLLQELRDRETYEKPTTARKKAKSQAKNRWQRKLRSESLPKKLY